MSKTIVLLVEDEPAHAELVQRAFERRADEFELLIAGTIDGARQSIQSREPDVIITDWVLPDGKGLDLLEQHQQIPLVLVTSFGNERIAVEAIKAGALDYVVKSDSAFTEMPHTAERARREWATRMEARLASEQLDRRIAELEAVNRVSTSLRQADTLDEILPLLLDETLSTLDAQDGIIWINQAGNRVPSRTFARGWFAQIDQADIHPERGIANLVLTSGEPHRSRDFSSEPIDKDMACIPFQPGWGGVCLPLRTNQETVGLMLVSVPLPRELTDDEVHVLTTLAEIAGNAVHRMRLHEQTERSLQRLAALHTIDLAITSSIDINLSLSVILDQTLSQLSVDAACVLQINLHAQTLEYIAGRGFRTQVARQTRLRIGEGYAGKAARDRRRILISDTTKTNSQFPSNLINSEGIQGYCAVPLIAKGNIKGVLEVFQRSPLYPGEDWYAYLDALTGQAALAIENWELFENLQRSNTELTLAYDATIEGWSRALDLRDRETEGHTQRVTELTLQLAQMLRVPDDALVHIRRGALLHDIGKMGIPDEILLKPGPLTDEEWAIMHQHPIYAQQMLAPISYLNQALDIPYCHHERWDGSGYPRGLRAEQIPLPARIFTVVDVWDALRSDRPYRKAWPEQKAREHLLANAGTHFDPQIVRTFLQMIQS